MTLTDCSDKSSRSSRRIYYIVGPSCSGKTTAAKRLAELHSINFCSVDKVYLSIHDSMQLQTPREAIFKRPWQDDPQKYGRQDWGEYGTFCNLLRTAYEKHLGHLTGDLILEGTALFYARDRGLVADVVGPHKAFILKVLLPFVEWAPMHFNRRRNDSVFSQEHIYEKVKDYYEPLAGDEVFSFSHPDKIDLSMIDGPVCNAERG